MERLASNSASIGQSPGRFEVITGEAARRSHADAFKGRLVALTLEPDVCIADIARAHDVHPQLLYTWRRQAKAGKLTLPADDTPDFAPVVIDEQTPRSPVPPMSSGSVFVEIEIDGVIVRVPDDADALRIAGIAAALREAL